MNPSSDLSLTSYFASLPHPRVDRTKKHLLGDILIIALYATIAGADSWPEVEQFGHVELAWRQTFLALPNGIPSHDTFQNGSSLASTRRPSTAAWPPGWPASARRLACGTSPSTARRPARPSKIPSVVACSWSTPGLWRTD